MLARRILNSFSKRRAGRMPRAARMARAAREQWIGEVCSVSARLCAKFMSKDGWYSE